MVPRSTGRQPPRPVAESTDLARIREHFRTLVRDEKARRREAGKPIATGLVALFPVVPTAYAIVAIPAVGVEVFGAEDSAPE